MESNTAALRHGTGTLTRVPAGREASVGARAGLGLLGTRWILPSLTFLGFAVPVVAYFWLIKHYSVNVIYGDQWDDVNVIAHSYHGTLGLGTLWAQHNENRILFPNLIVLLLSRTTHFNIVFEQYLMGLMQVASVALLVLSHKRRSPRTRWICYCPVAFLMLSFVQHGNTLWGFQMAWYLVMLMFAVTVYLIDRQPLGKVAFVGAIATAVIGSFSSLQGLIIWPAALLLLLYRHRSRPFLVSWISAAAVTSVIYFIGFNGNTTTTKYGALVAFKYPVAALRFFFFAIGDIVGVDVKFSGVNVASNGAGNTAVLAFGILIVALAVIVVWLYGIRGRETGSGPVGISMIAFGLLFAGMITQGRLWGGFWAASASRYTTFDVLVLAGTYLVMLDWRRAEMPFAGRAAGNRAASTSRWAGALARARASQAGHVITTLLLVMIAVQVVVGTKDGIPGAREDHSARVEAAGVLANFERVPDGRLTEVLYPFSSATQVRPWAEVAKRHRLSLFADMPVHSSDGRQQAPK